MAYHALQFIKSNLNSWWFKIGLVLIGYVGVNGYLMRVTVLPVSGYAEPWLILEVVKNISGRWITLLPLISVIAVFALRFRLLSARWTFFQNGKLIRIIVVTSAFLIAWTYLSYGKNYYLDQWHLVPVTK
ncbi:MAG: hypothetical protein O3C20_04155 [Verrucomicrobia bacterium]|nr:hypothetical protein [Verrucomicrobiota bacterium]